MSKPQWVIDAESEDGEDISDIIERELQYGTPMSEIAASFGVSYWVLRGYINKIGAKSNPEPRSYKHSFFKVRAARMEWEQRKTIKQLAQKYDVPYATMCSWLYYVSRAEE